MMPGMGGELGGTPEVEDVRADWPKANTEPRPGEFTTMEQDRYPSEDYTGPAIGYDVESECHVELTVRIGGQQLILRREWQNDPTLGQAAIAATVAQGLVNLAKAYAVDGL